MPAELSSKIQKEVLEIYFKILNVPETSKVTGYATSTIYRILRKFEVELKPQSYLKDKHKDSKCFTDFTREDDSYFYGLLLSDGNLSHSESRLSRIQIALQRRDEDILCKFKSFIGTENKIVRYDKKITEGTSEHSHIGVNSYTIYNRLIGLGMSPRKSGKEQLPKFDWLNNKDFWRGVIDGDGSLHYQHGAPKIKLIGSLELVEGFNDFCWKNCFTQKRKAYPELKHEGLYTISFNGEEAMYIAKILYTDCDLRLDRKLILAKEFVEYYENHRDGMKKGVNFYQKYSSYKSSITKSGTRISLGSFKNYEEALLARIRAEVVYYDKCFGDGKWHSILFQQLE